MVKPLTKTNRTGKLLERPAEVEKELAEILALTPERILKRAQSTEGHDKDALSSECLVHLIRHRGAKSDGQFLKSLTEILSKRCTRTLGKAVIGFPIHRRDEVVDKISQQLIDILLEKNNRADFFEVRFNQAFKRLRIDVIRRCRQDAAFYSTPANEREDARDEFTLQTEFTEPYFFSLDNIIQLRKALRTLTNEEYEILLLHYCKGVPINSVKTNPHNLVQLTGLSERTIRNRLQAAKNKLKTIMKEEPSHDSDAPHHNGS